MLRRIGENQAFSLRVILQMPLAFRGELTGERGSIERWWSAAGATVWLEAPGQKKDETR
jgi:hypothetical protein